MRFWFILTATLICTAGLSMAQEVDQTLPNPLRNQNLVETCQNMSAQIRAGDPAVMATLVGVWEGQSILPGVPGLYPDTPQQIRTANNADGTFSIDYYACFEPYEQQPACAQSFRYGEWTAHIANDGWIAVPFVSFGSAYTGEALPASCGLNYVRLLNPQTMVDQGGAQMYRTQ
jgi:hypothetical protein